MKLVRQPADSNLCGQACVATLAGCSLEQAIEACGTAGKTRTHHIRHALSLLTALTPEWRRRAGWPPALSVAMLNWISTAGDRRHWTVYSWGKHFDPAAGVFRRPPRYLTNGGRMISHLRIFV